MASMRKILSEKGADEGLRRFPQEIEGEENRLGLQAATGTMEARNNHVKNGQR